jgi:ribose 5-phosphate isomerase B
MRILNFIKLYILVVSRLIKGIMGDIVKNILNKKISNKISNVNISNEKKIKQIESKKIGNILGFIASDHRGYELKSFLKEKFPLIDLGAFSDKKKTDYPDYANNLSKYVLKEKSKGILICSTGIGMSIAANRHKGIRAALCRNEGTVEIARYHNDANILVLAGDYTTPDEAYAMVKRFFDGKFSNEERHKRRIKKLG